MTELNEKTYINLNNIVLAEQIGDEYFIITRNGNRLNVTAEQYEEIKAYDPGSGGGSTGPVVYETSTDATLVSGDTYELDLAYLSATPEVDDYVAYVESDTISTLYIVTNVDATTVTLTKIGDVGGGGGGAELNIAYGLTPPSDTSKIWVKCDTPSKVKIEANRELVISSNENAKKVKTEAIGRTQINSSAYRNPSHLMVKMGNDYYICSGNQGTTYFGGDTISNGRVFKIDSEGNKTTLWESGNSSNYSSLGLFKYDDTHIIYIFVSSIGTPSVYAYIIDITNGTDVHYNFASGNAGQFTYGIHYNDGKIYSIVGEDSSTNKVFFNVYTLNGTLTQYTVNMPSGLYRAVAPCSPIYYNAALYFILNVGDTAQSASSTFTKQPKLYKWVIGDSQIVEVLTLPYIKYSGTNYGISFYTPLLYGNKMFITNLNHFRSSSIATPDSSVVYIVDLVAETYETLDLTQTFSLAYTCLNDNTGDLEIWGGYPSSSSGLQKRIIYNIYELEENTLDLFYDTYFTKNIRLIDSPTITIDAPIDHAWLGDENNIAQSINMYYYDENTTTWKGINCEDYTEE